MITITIFRDQGTLIDDVKKEEISKTLRRALERGKFEHGFDVEIQWVPTDYQYPKSRALRVIADVPELDLRMDPLGIELPHAIEDALNRAMIPYQPNPPGSRIHNSVIVRCSAILPGLPWMNKKSPG